MPGESAYPSQLQLAAMDGSNTKLCWKRPILSQVHYAPPLCPAAARAPPCHAAPGFRLAVLHLQQLRCVPPVQHFALDDLAVAVTIGCIANLRGERGLSRPLFLFSSAGVVTKPVAESHPAWARDSGTSRGSWKVT